MRTLPESQLLSWKEIWLAVETGKHREILKAIDEHVERFPASERDLVRARTMHIVRSTQRDTDTVRDHIRRVSRTLKALQRGRFRPANDEDSRYATELA